LEDDVVFHPQTRTILNEYLENLPKDAQYFKLGYIMFDLHVKNRIVEYNSHFYKSLQRGVPTTMCYAIHTSLLEYLISITFEHAIDDIEIPNAYLFKRLINDNVFFKCENYKTSFHGICSEIPNVKSSVL
jgi:GR25 family glycosyltransferase involved in LPS biosynthesis